MRLYMCLEHAVAGHCHRRHHPVGADGDDAVRSIEGNLLWAKLAFGVSRHGLHDVAGEPPVIGAVGLESRRFVAAPDDDIGSGFDFGDLVAVDDFLVAGEVEHLRTRGAQGLADREQHRVAEAAAHQHHGFIAVDFGGRSGRPHQDHRFAWFQYGTEVGGTAHLQHDGGDQALLPVDPRAGQRQAFHRQPGAVHRGCQGFEILQPVELTGLELACGQRGAHHDLDDGGREPDDFMHGCAQRAVQPGQEFCIVSRVGRLHPAQDGAHHRVALLGAAHGLHHVAEEGGMQVAEEADEAAVGAPVQQHLRPRRLGAPFRLDRIAFLVTGLEIASVEMEVAGVLARQHRVGLGAGRHKHAPRGKGRGHLGAAAVRVRDLAGDGQASRVTEFIHFNRRRRQVFREADAFLQGLLHFFVIQRVGRAVDQALPVGEGNAAPGLQQFQHARLAALFGGAYPLHADGARVRQEFIRNSPLDNCPRSPHLILAAFGAEGFETAQEFLDLQRVIGKGFGRRVDRGQAATDDHHRQAHLHVGDGIVLGRASELQGHEEIRCRAHAGRESIGNVEDSRAAGAGGQHHVIEAQVEGVIGGDRAAEPHAAE